MNITYLIGNGFDLNLGLKTRYSDFYQYYLHLPNKNETIKLFKEELSENIKYWSDLELVLGEYSKKFTDKNIDDFIELLDDIQDSLADYIDNQSTGLALTEKGRDHFHDDLFYCENHLNELEQEDYISFKKNYYGQNCYANIIIFNYTKSFENLLNFKSSITLGTHYYSYKQYSHTLNKIEHIHGTTDKNMILGVNDSTQISNEKLSKNKDICDALVKPVMNKNCGTLREKRCLNYIEDSDVIVIFGMSLGETDKLWWNSICNKLKNEECRLIIFTRDGEIVQRRGYRLKNKKEIVKGKLLKYCNFSDEEKAKMAEKIFVCFNSEMFKVG